MLLAQVKYVGDARYSFQADTPAEVLRLVWVKFDTDKTREYRLCLHLKYPDGREDFPPLDEALENKYLVQPKV